MKNVFKAFSLFSLVALMMNCSEKDDHFQEPLKDFALEKTEVTLTPQSSESIKIISGNGEYGIIPKTGSEKTAQVLFSPDKQTFEVTGISEGKATVTITDTKKNAAITVTVFVLALEEKKIEEFDYSLQKQENAKKIYHLAYEYYHRFKELEKEISNYPALPDNQYKGQNYAWKYGVEFSEQTKHILDSYTEQTEIGKLFKAYEDICAYGYIYARIELMARKAEVFRKQFPAESKISDIITKTFDGLYTTQEGNTFILGVNKDIISNYNEIVKMVNEAVRNSDL